MQVTASTSQQVRSRDNTVWGVRPNLPFGCLNSIINAGTAAHRALAMSFGPSKWIPNGLSSAPIVLVETRIGVLTGYWTAPPNCRRFLVFHDGYCVGSLRRSDALPSLLSSETTKVDFVPKWKLNVCEALLTRRESFTTQRCGDAKIPDQPDLLPTLSSVMN